jgi:ADP-heptose:LPS heptosyltransferase
LNSYQAILHVYPNKKIALLAKKQNIQYRIGTSHRVFHWWTCNKLVNFSRKNSDLHEAELNEKLLFPLLDVQNIINKDNIPDYYGFTHIKPLEIGLSKLLDNDKTNIILHPKSKGSAREWKVSAYADLINKMDNDKYHFFITGTEAEGKQIKEEYPQIYDFENVTSLEGKISLSDLPAFIQAVDVFISCSTGPLHIAAALGIKAIGLYPVMKPIHPGRWAPIGKKAIYLIDKQAPLDCTLCKKTMDCKCIQGITTQQVKRAIEQ